MSRSVFRGAAALRRAIRDRQRSRISRGRLEQLTAADGHESRQRRDGSTTDTQVSTGAPAGLQSSAEIRAEHVRLTSRTYAFPRNRCRWQRRNSHHKPQADGVWQSPVKQVQTGALIRDCNPVGNMADALASAQATQEQKSIRHSSDAAHTSCSLPLTDRALDPCPSLKSANRLRRKRPRSFPGQSPPSAVQQQSQLPGQVRVLSASTTSH